MNRKLIFLDIDGTLLPPGEMLIPGQHPAGAAGGPGQRAQAVSVHRTQPAHDRAAAGVRLF